MHSIHWLCIALNTLIVHWIHWLVITQEHEQSVLCWVHCASLPESEFCHLIIDSHFHFHFFTLTLNSHVSLSLPSFTPTWKVYSYVSLSLLSFTLTLKVHSYVSLSHSLVWTRWTQTHMWSVILRLTLTKPRLRRTQTILTKRTLVNKLDKYSKKKLTITFEI